MNVPSGLQLPHFYLVPFQQLRRRVVRTVHFRRTLLSRTSTAPYPFSMKLWNGLAEQMLFLLNGMIALSTPSYSC
jgi:hypothetical protein